MLADYHAGLPLNTTAERGYVNSVANQEDTAGGDHGPSVKGGKKSS
jgi:hypothetical protein